MQNRKISGVLCALVAFAFAIGTMIVPQVSQAQTTNQKSLAGAATALVQGPVSTTAGAAAGTFSGVLNVTSVAVQNGQLVATGTLKGTITNLDGTTTAVNQAVTAPVANVNASCPILSLTLGPLHLNVLGLVIDLNQVNLNIVAQPGAGNLLGNLLCAVANLLNGGGALSAIAAALTSILNLINGL